MLAFVLLIGLSLGSYCWVSLRTSRVHLVNSLAAEARQTSASLAITSADAIKTGQYRSLHTVSRELVRSSHNIVFVSFSQTDGVPIVTEAQGGKFKAPTIDTTNLAILGTPIVEHSPRFKQYIACTSPILGPGSDGLIGYVRVGVSMEQYNEQTAAVTRTAAQVGAGLMLFAIPAAWLLVKRIFLPIRVLVSAAKRIAGGDLDSFVETQRPDVIGDLARAFNEMVQTVKGQQEELRKANQKLGEANRDLEGKVDQRTLQLETANKRLSVEIAEKEDFLRAVSHDLNAPLRNISGMVTMLLMKKKAQLDEDTLHRLDRIKKNVEIETDLINELLELSRIKTRRQAMENVDIEAMVWELRGMFENDLKTREIHLIVDTQLPQLYCERARVRQIFQNLIDNAIKYMGEGQRKEIHVGCQIRLSEAEFYVRDTGLGIDADDVSKVFFVFRRGKNTAAQNVAGKGVGLASVKSIIETYSGKIWVESELGKGSTFRFTINGQYVPATGGGARAMSDKTNEAEQETAQAA
jgi:signal transduction histidine kinase